MVKAFQDLLSSGRKIWTTAFVLVETTALLQHRIGLAPIRDLADRFGPVLAVDWVSEDLYVRGLQRLFREDRRQLSLVDCVSMEFMRLSGLEDVLGMDPHFEQAGFSLLPRRRK